MTLAWDPNPDPNIQGYVIEYGTQPGTHPFSVSVGNQTAWQINDLAYGMSYYFVVRARNTSGVLSAPSVEVSQRVGVRFALTPSDIDGDHMADPLVWRPSTGTWLGTRSSDGGTLNRQWGAGLPPYNDVPVPGDYDGDGKTDLAVWRPGEGVWYVIQSTTGTVLAVQWGAGLPPYNDVPVPGDYDGDGKTDIAVWRPDEGVWYVIQSSTGTGLAVQWGAGSSPYNDVPVPGDYDADGKTDFAVWRPGAGFWYVRGSAAGLFSLEAPGGTP